MKRLRHGGGHCQLYDRQQWPRKDKLLAIGTIGSYSHVSVCIRIEEGLQR